MKIDLEPGKYIVAVSGGVDSVVLLDLIAKHTKSPNSSNIQHPTSSIQLVVAHLDHGIRPDSVDDAIFVMELAEKYGLPFVGGSVRLGPSASEEEARVHRYAFLRRVKDDCKADAIIAAHHQDDVIETAIINTLRGTSRKGLSSLKSTREIKRPLLDKTKKELLDYARSNKLEWRDDSTNQDPKYLRNRVRLSLGKNLDNTTRQNVVELLIKMHKLNIELDNEHANLLAEYAADGSINRSWFIKLPHKVAMEVLAFWLRFHDQSFDSRSLARLTNSIKTDQVGNKADVSGGSYILIGKDQISLKA
jgi:tRNA(Ile)-lysidine synthetase-like protein